MKNKYIVPLNYKAIIIVVFYLILLCCGIKVWIENISANNLKNVIVGFCFILCFVFILISFFFKIICFKQNFFYIPKEMSALFENKKRVYYTDIISVKYIKRNEEGLHVKGIFRNKNTIVINCKNTLTYLFSTNFFTKKQINSILDEVKKRSNINNL